MHLYDILLSEESAAHKTLKKFSVSIKRNEIWRPIEDVKFVFLCGANIEKNISSKRRQILLKFASRHLPHTKFFLAESFFEALEEEGRKANLLDIENDLSNFSDFVIIILESESAFCELGAFAIHKELRKKLIIINDDKHKKSESFINFGPIKAISEATDRKNILYYRMDEDGKVRGDSIGQVFSGLHKILHRVPKVRRERIVECDPNNNFNKDSLRFIHDLIFFASPISFKELSIVIRIIFSKSKDYQIQKHLGMLCATEQIKQTPNKLYVSLYKQPFFEYGPFDIYNLIASFKNLYFRYDNKRINEIN